MISCTNPAVTEALLLGNCFAEISAKVQMAFAGTQRADVNLFKFMIVGRLLRRYEELTWALDHEAGLTKKLN